MNDDFFEKAREQSIIKSQIVSKYFAAWSTIMKKNNKIGYIDLFSGPGIFSDGYESTPIKIIKYCLSNDTLCKKVILTFNDSNKKYADCLKESISKIDGIEKLANYPDVYNINVDKNIAEIFNKVKLIPCFSFIDPWGYKGLSKNLINALIKDWGCDCIFFFNYNRINAAIDNNKVEEEIDSIFGNDIADLLRENVKDLSPSEREQFVINELSLSLSKFAHYILPFQFQFEDRKATSHYLIFASKDKLGYGIMKEIMCGLSSDIIDGVGSFSFIPTHDKQLSFLYGYNMPINSLKDDLLRKFSGKTLTVKEIYYKHNYGTNFIMKNYQEALRRLESENKIIVDPPADKRRKIKGVISMAVHNTITFPCY